MAAIKDYKARIKELINKLYEPADITNYDTKMTTADIYQNLCSILPERSFDEFDVIEVLEELNFFPGYEQKKETYQNAEGKEVERVYDDLTYFWYLKKKVNNYELN